MNNIDITEKENSLVVSRFSELKTERAKHMNVWKDIQNLVAITNNIDSEFDDKKDSVEQKDIFINDPTGFISVNQAGDYLEGILWGKNAITIKPSEYIKKKTAGSDFSDFYKGVTKKVLQQINATESGFETSLKSHCYEQFSYGTSGIGAFKSKEYLKGQSECCLNYKVYGVWNVAVDEGADSKVNVVYTVYNRRLNQVIEEFCANEKGDMDEELYNNLPEEIKKSYEANKFNDKFKIVFAVLPNNSFVMKKRGKKGAKYKGYWFLDGSDKRVFKVDYFRKMPIAICRAIKSGNQIYGDSPASLTLSSMKMLNHISGEAVDNIEKINNPALGLYSGALAAGNVFNRSANAVNVFNPQSAQNGASPVFPIAQAGDPSGLLNYLIPELKKTITDAYKLDKLLDFNNQTQMTATESMYRMSIRGKSICGLINQQKSELLEPILIRSIQIMEDCGIFGHKLSEMPENTKEEIEEKKRVIKEGNYIPAEIEEAMKDGKIWYEIEFNGEIEKLNNSESYEALGRFLQYLQAILSLKPELVHALNEYEFLELVKSISNLTNDKLIKSKARYEEILANIKEEQEVKEAMLIQAQAMKNGGIPQDADNMAEITGGV